MNRVTEKDQTLAMLDRCDTKVINEVLDKVAPFGWSAFSQKSRGARMVHVRLQAGAATVVAGEGATLELAMRAAIGVVYASRQRSREERADTATFDMLASPAGAE